MSLIQKMGKAIQNRSQKRLSSSEWKRLNVIVDRYGATVIAKQINKLPYKRLDAPIGYIEKMAQAYLIKEVKPGTNSSILTDILKEKNEFGN